MSLPACQQRTLDRIDTALRVREPRLASMFAIFTRLAGDEETPWWERLQAPRWRGGRLRVVVLIPLALVSLACAVLLCVNLGGAPAGRQAPAACGVALTISPVRTCLPKAGSSELVRG
jgi:hypothetical protein